MSYSTSSTKPSLMGFYSNKSIVNSYSFDIYFDFGKMMTGNKLSKDTNNRINSVYYYLSNLKSYHFLSVDFPFNSFNREKTNIGTTQFSHPVISSEQALDLKFVVEEDDRGNISGLIHALQNTVVDIEGYHVPLNHMILGYVLVVVYNRQGTPIYTFKAEDVFYLGSNGHNVSYESNDSVKYDLVLGFNKYKYENVSKNTQRDLIYSGINNDSTINNELGGIGISSINPPPIIPPINVAATLGSFAIKGIGKAISTNRPETVENTENIPGFIAQMGKNS